jgi:DNA repair exonuclease SbcCD nuclease subunit
MIKGIHEITVGDVVLLKETENAAHLISKYIPSLFLRRRIEKLAVQIFERLGTKNIAELENEFDKILAFRNLQKLEALWIALDIEMNLRVNLNSSLLLIGKNEIPSLTFNAVIEKIKELGIDIKLVSDVKEFENFIEFKKDVYLENYQEKEESEGDDVDFVEIIYKVFRYMGEPYNENMRFLSFITMKKIAEGISLKNALNNSNNG